jgi:hypothetical protein
MSLLKKAKKQNVVKISTKDDYSYSYEYTDDEPTKLILPDNVAAIPTRRQTAELPLPVNEQAPEKKAKARPAKTAKQMQALQKARETRARNAQLKKDTENKLYAVRLEKERKRLEKNVKNKVNRQMKADHMTKMKQEIAEAELSEYSDEGYQPVPKKRQIRAPKPTTRSAPRARVKPKPKPVYDDESYDDVSEERPHEQVVQWTPAQWRAYQKSQGF